MTIIIAHSERVCTIAMKKAFRLYYMYSVFNFLKD